MVNARNLLRLWEEQLKIRCEQFSALHAALLSSFAYMHGRPLAPSRVDTSAHACNVSRVFYLNMLRAEIHTMSSR